MSDTRTKTGRAPRWVIKIGSALLVNPGGGLHREFLEVLVQQVVQLKQNGHEIVLVSSGAVAEGMTRMGWLQRPKTVHKLQAAAAIGQMGLIQAYESRFQRLGEHTAQVLLTHDDVANRKRYLNARTSLRTLIDLGIVPIVNENDTVATDEIRLGDNDTLSGLVSNLIEADLLVILTDQAGLYESDPRKNPAAKLVAEAEAGDQTLRAYAGQGGSLGRGGMQTKLRAAKIAAQSGTNTIIAGGEDKDVLLQIARGDKIGTLLRAGREGIAAKKQWLANQASTRGDLVIDDGALRALREQGKSLLAVGITEVRGNFKRGEIVACLNQQGKEIARGLINYSALETTRLIGKNSDEFETILGYIDADELIHRDNLILV